LAVVGQCSGGTIPAEVGATLDNQLFADTRSRLHRRCFEVAVATRSRTTRPPRYLQLSTAMSPLAQAVTCANVQAETSVAVAEQLVWLQSQLFRTES
jgi:hypothetical protein